MRGAFCSKQFSLKSLNYAKKIHIYFSTSFKREEWSTLSHSAKLLAFGSISPGHCGFWIVYNSFDTIHQNDNDIRREKVAEAWSGQ